MKWSVRTRIAVACLCCAVVPLLAFATYTYWRASGTLQAERDLRFAEHEVAAGRALDDLTVAEIQAIGAYAGWGRFASAVRAGDNQWLRGQLETLASAAGGTAQVFTTDGRPVIASGRELPAGVVWKTVEVQDLVNGVFVDTPASGFHTIGGRLVIVTAQYIAAPGRPDEREGLLVVVRPVDGQALADVGEATGVSVSAVSSREAASLRAAAPDASSGVLNQVGTPFDEGDDRSVYLAVFDADGYRSALVKMAMDQSAVRSATSDLRTMAGVALLLAVLASTVAALLLSRHISRPLRRLSTAAVAMAGGETRQTIEVRGDDEVARLAGAFNAMSERVSERLTELSGMLRGLASEMADLNLVFGRTLLDTVDPRAELGGHMLAEVADLAQADAACVFLEGPRGLDFVAATAPGGEEATAGLAGRDAACRSGAAAQLATRAIADAGAVRQTTPEGVHLVAASLHDEDAPGALVLARRAAEFDEEETALATLLAGQIAATLGNAEAWRRLESSYHATVAALAGALSVKDEYPEAHPRTVADVAGLLAGQLGMTGADRRLLRYAGILHDVGKTGVPERILRKPGPLSAEESSLVRGHALVGEHIVSQIDYLRPAGPVIRAVHERWDGLGYPDRLEGEHIPAASRVLLVADAYVAMTSPRPYRQALSHEQAVEEVRVNAGGQFDPEVARALVEVSEQVRAAAAGDARRAAAPDRVLTTVLFIDLVDSTARAAELGDEAWKDELLRFHRVVARELAEHRGTQIDAVGDGVFARFDGAARAVRCALAIGRDLDPLGLRVRAGCHSGEVEVGDGHVDGLSVHIGARVAAVAAPGEVLVSATVRDLVAGSGLSFTERGEHELKGVPGTWRLFAARD